MLTLAGVTCSDRSGELVTVSVVDAETLVQAAVIVVEPAANDVATPYEPEALLMVAMAVSDEFQVTVEVRSWVVLSENVPMAVNC